MLSLRDKYHPERTRQPEEYPLTFSTDESPFLKRVLERQKSILIATTLTTISVSVSLP